VLASAFMVLTPMFLFFGRMTNHEVVANGFILAAIYYYLCWIETCGAKYYTLLLVSLILAMLAGWPGYYAAGLLAAHGMFCVGNRLQGNVWRIAVFPALAIIMFGILLGHVYLLEGREGLVSLWDRFLMRSGGGFRWSQFAVTLARYFDYGFTPLILILALLYALFEARRGLRPISGDSHARSLLSVMFGLALVHVVLFKQGASEHPYWIFYFLAPLAICAARAVLVLARASGIRYHKSLAAGGCVVFLAALAWLSYPRLQYFYSPNRVQSVQLGQEINHQSSPGDVIVLPTGYQGTQLPYYADRDLRYGIQTITALERILGYNQVNYRYFLVPRGQVISDHLEGFLSSRYAATASNGHVFYDLTSHR
jgi:hypothetical protein